MHLDQGEPGEGDIVLSLLHGHQHLGWMTVKDFFRHHLMVSLTKVSSLLSQHQLLLSTNQSCFLIETLSCLDKDCGLGSLKKKEDYLATHQLHKHMEGGWFQVSTRCMGEVFQDVLQSFG